jgi:hypothetical protein
VDIATRLYNLIKVSDGNTAEALKEFESQVLDSFDVGSLSVVVFNDLTAIVLDHEEHSISCLAGIIFRFMSEEMIRDMVENHAH